MTLSDALKTIEEATIALNRLSNLDLGTVGEDCDQMLEDLRGIRDVIEDEMESEDVRS